MTIAKPIFLDTGFAIALLSPRDQYHAAARRLAVELRTAPARVVTTDAVIYHQCIGGRRAFSASGFCAALVGRVSGADTLRIPNVSPK